MSGVYIPGMEMPISCDVCPFNVFRICLINTLQEGKYTVTHSCPLVPVPDHGRLIDADEVLLQIQDYIEEYGWTVDEHGWHSDKWCAMKEAEDVLNDAPTIIEADKEARE